MEKKNKGLLWTRWWINY